MVEVLLVDVSPVKLPFVALKLVVKKFVEVLLVNTDEEARSVPGSVSVFTALL